MYSFSGLALVRFNAAVESTNWSETIDHFLLFVLSPLFSTDDLYNPTVLLATAPGTFVL